MNGAARKSFLVKIIPPDGYSVYRLAFTRRHVAAAAVAVVCALVAAIAVHSWELQRAQADVRALQSLTGKQQQQLRAIDTEADALAGELRAMQQENAQIRRLIGAPKAPHAFVAVPSAAVRGRNVAAVQARLRRLAVAAAAARRNARELERVALRVLDLRRLAQIARVRMLAEIPSIMPVEGRIAAGFGWRTNPWPEFHKGVDLAAAYGATVRAAAAGTVVSAGWDAGFGIKVDIDHGNGYHTWYAHLSKALVTPGERVVKGEPIAQVGSTGESTGPHLHYQVMKDGVAIDPAPFLAGIPPSLPATLPRPGGV